jgi:hypothetical protein
MATGAYDANGIWNYGEDDNIALFSDTLNMLAESTSDAFTDDRARLSTLEAGSLAGIIPLAPTSVVVATGTAAANALGTVTFTGATSLSLNDVFTSIYRNYFIAVDYVSSTNLELRLRLRTTSDDSTSTSYQDHSILWGSDGGSLNYANNATAGYSRLTLATGSYKAHFNTIIADPNNSVQTNYSGRFAYRSNSGVHFDGVFGGNTTTTTQYTGFTIYPSTGNVTGTVTVYGYND